jgi:hypothetical protein
MMDKWCVRRTVDKDLTYVIDIESNSVRIYAMRPKKTKVGCFVLRGKWANSFAHLLSQNEFLTYSDIPLVLDVDVGERVNNKEDEDA